MRQNKFFIVSVIQYCCNTYCAMRNHGAERLFSLFFIVLNWERHIKNKIILRYTHALLSFPRSFLVVNHHNNKNWVPSILTYNLWLIFMGMKQKKKKKFENCSAFDSSQKNWHFQLRQFSFFLKTFFQGFDLWLVR